MSLFMLKSLFVIVFMSGLFTFCSKRKHLLMTLLSLEFIMLGLFMMIFYYLNNIGFEMYFSMVFLTLVVCEGTLGLGILVSLVRFYGNDYFQSYINLRC